MASVALIGFGEVGHIFGRDLTANGARVATYDIVFDDPAKRGEHLARVEAAGVHPAANAAAAAEKAEIVISAVTADAAAEVAKESASYLNRGQNFFDITSSSPRTKKTGAGHVEAAGAHYTEGAVMAGVQEPGLKVPILAGGPAAAELAQTLNALGMNITPVATEHGRASSIKLCRSILMKGLDALMIEWTEAARRCGVEAEVLASLQATYPGMDWAKLADRTEERVSKHGARRAAEMREAAQMLEDLDRDPALALAIANVVARFGKGER